MTLVEQWHRVEAELPPGWREARLSLAPADPARAERAGALLGPLGPGRAGSELRLSVVRGGAPGPEALRRLLSLLDEEGIAGRLQLVQATGGEAAPEGRHEPDPLTAAWDRLLAGLPQDWSDLVCVIELTSSDDLPPAALALAPVNPSRHGQGPAFRFRVARTFGYGAAPQMARRCLARLDEQGIRGRLRLLHALASSRPVATQGPVWHLGGRAV